MPQWDKVKKFNYFNHVMLRFTIYFGSKIPKIYDTRAYVFFMFSYF